MLAGRSSAGAKVEATAGLRPSVDAEPLRVATGRWRIGALPLASLMSQAPLGVAPGFYWRPSQGRVCAAFGGVVTLRDGRMASSIRCEQRAGDGEAAPLRLFGGFAFDAAEAHEGGWGAWGGARFVAPEVVLEEEAGGAVWMTIATRVMGEEPAAVVAARLEAARRRWVVALAEARAGVGVSEAPPVLGQDDGSGTWYRAGVAEVVERLSAGSGDAGGLRKVVLARPSRVALGGPMPPGLLLEALAAAEPQCTQFMVPAGQWSGRGRWWASDTYFAGSTPEWLVRVERGEVAVDAVAGTGAVGEGEALLGSAKDRVEHALVVDAIAGALARHCVEVERPVGPGLKVLRDMLHLWTPFRARLMAGQTVLDVARSLHPTPAVCGHPTDAARRVLTEIERAHGFVRGWYAGAVGWFDLEGQGELAVALRCGRMAPMEAELYVGAGLVGGSEPEAEVEETRMKLRPMLRALGAEGHR